VHPVSTAQRSTKAMGAPVLSYSMNCANRADGGQQLGHLRQMPGQGAVRPQLERAWIDRRRDPSLGMSING